MATLNLAVLRGLRWRPLAVVAAVVFLPAHLVVAELAASPTNLFAAYFDRIYVKALEEWRGASNNVEISWQLGRACYDKADYATNNAQRAALAEQGMAACRHALQLHPKSVAAYYYLGLNTGQLARTKLFTALYLVSQLEDALLASIAIDATYDYAGAHRALGALYRDAPGWPTSVGSRAKSRQNLEKALELFPDYPGNQILFIESLLEWGDKKAARAQLPIAEQAIKTARPKLAGDAWAPSWEEWDRRWQILQAKAAVEPARSPRSSQ